MNQERELSEILRLLPMFVAIAEEGSITAAAELLELPQPSVSRSMTRLSELVGAPVLRRSGRGVTLSPAGLALLPAATESVLRLREGLADVRRQESVGSGVVALSFQTILGARVVPALIRRFRDRHPTVRFDLLQGARQVCLDAVLSGASSIALIADPPAARGCRAVPLYDEALVVVCAPTHRFAGRVVSLAELDGEPQIVLKPGFGLRTQTENLFAAAGLRLHVAFEVDDARTARGLAAACLGVAIVPAGRGEVTDDRATEARIDDPRARRTIGALIREDDDATVVAFGEFLQTLGRSVALAAL